MSRRAVLLWLLVAGCMAGIFVLSSLPRLPHVPILEARDKVQHAIAFGVLAVLTVLAMRNTWPGVRLAALALSAAAFSTAYGVTDEFHQRFVPNRTFDVYDLVADLVGAAAAVMIWLVMIQRRKRRDET